MVKSSGSKSSRGTSPPAHSRSLLANSSRSSLEALSNLASVNINEQTRARQRAAERDQKIRLSAGRALAAKQAASPRIGRIIEEGEKGLSSEDTVRQYELDNAETVLESCTVLEVTRHMAAKKLHFVLIVNGKGQLVGILTDKDLAFRVVAEGLEPKKTAVEQVMTRNPLCVQSSVSMIEALTQMVAHHFRHLPVKEGDRLIGVLDITQCLCDAIQKLELADAAATQIANAIESVREFQAIEGLRVNLGNENNNSSNIGSAADQIRDRLACPKIGVLLQDARSHYPRVSAKCSVEEAVRIMRGERRTAVLVTDSRNDQELVGIFTTKDVLLRVIAGHQDPAKTSINRVMTPYPDAISPRDTVVSALRQMQSRHYLHLPVVNERQKGRIEGVLDILQLTWSLLEQLGQLDHITQEPLWHQLWAPYDNTKPPLDQQITLLPARILFKIRFGSEVVLLTIDNAFNLPTLLWLITQCREHFTLKPSGSYLLQLIDEDGKAISIRDDDQFHSLVQAILSTGRDRVNLNLKSEETWCLVNWNSDRLAGLFRWAQDRRAIVIPAGMALFTVSLAAMVTLGMKMIKIKME